MKRTAQRSKRGMSDAGNFYGRDKVTYIDVLERYVEQLHNEYLSCRRDPPKISRMDTYDTFQSMPVSIRVL
jgi:hypothetical protein